jgi:hypothetical protein
MTAECYAFIVWYLTDPGAGTAPGSFEGVVLVDE